jgi:hypothetical protein
VLVAPSIVPVTVAVLASWHLPVYLKVFQALRWSPNSGQIAKIGSCS